MIEPAAGVELLDRAIFPANLAISPPTKMATPAGSRSRIIVVISAARL